jgi:CHAT domain-containing protein/tetratricopeptide (TPR) repeat protein
VSGPEPLKEGRDLTAEERTEVGQLRVERNEHIFAGRFEEAVKASKTIVAYRAERQGRNHWQVIDAQGEVQRCERLTSVPAKDRAEVGRALKTQGEGSQLRQRLRHHEAEEKLRLALDILRKALGEQHPDTGAGYNDVASCLHAQGKRAEALPLFEKGLAICQKTLGEQHPHTAGSYNNVAFCLNAQGKRAEALPLYQKALAIQLKVLGEQHPSTATSYDNLANCLHAQGERAETLLLFQKALAIRQKVLGEEHLKTAASYVNLASCLNDLGKHAQALPLYQKALGIRQKVLGEEHSDTAASYHNLASCLNSQARHAEALSLFQKGLAIRQKILGEQHRDTAASYFSLASCLNDQGKHGQALPLFQKALDIYQKVLGEQHPHTASSYNRLADCLNDLGRHADAVRHWEKALLGQEFGRLQVNATGFERALFRDRYVSPQSALAGGLVRLQKPVQAWQHAEAAIARGLLDDLLPGESADPDKLARLNTLNQSLLPLLVRETLTAEEIQQRQIVTKERDELLAELAARAVQHSRDRVLPLPQIQKQIPSDAAIVFWLDTHDQHLGCVLRREGPPVWVPLFGSGMNKAWSQVDLLLPSLVHLTMQAEFLSEQTKQELLKRRSETDRAIVRRALEPRQREQLGTALQQQRLAPLEPHLEGVRLLLIVSAGAMAAVPVEALTDRYTVSYISSASIFARRMAQHRQLEASSLLVLADPVFTRTTAKLPPAPPHGLLIQAITPGSLATRIGLRPGDVLLEYAEVKLSKPEDLKRSSEERVPIKFWREGKELQGRIPGGPLGLIVDKRPIAEALAEWRKKETTFLSVGRGEPWQALPGTRLEARTLAGLIPRAEVLLGSAASEQKLDELAQQGKLKDYRLLHLATHGQVNEVRPELTALILSQERLPSPAEAAALVLKGQKPPEGKLTVGRMLQRDWQLDADLVVLSACQTGLGKATHGEGELGFTQALLQKGARSVVLSRWKVDDSATALLMARFYENLLGRRAGDVNPPVQPMKRAEALWEAKSWLRNLSRAEAEKRLAALVDGVPRGERGSIKAALPTRKPEDPREQDRPFAHPYFWAAFVLIGDPF